MEAPRGVEPTGTNGRTRHTLSDPLVGSGLVLWWFLSLDGKECCFLWSRDERSKRFCSRPLSGSRTATIGIGRVVWFRFCRPILVVGRYIGFAVVMAQVRRPVPFRTRKLRPGTAMVLHSRGCGRVARRRILSLGVPVELRLREPPFFYALLCRPAGRSTLPGVPVGPFPLLGVRIIPRAGRPRTPRDFRNFRGASCAYPMVE